MRLIGWVLFSVILFGCGTTREKWVNQNCNEPGGFAIGQKDAHAGRNFNTETLEKCPTDKIEATRKGYLDGYKAAGGKEQEDGEYKYGQDVLKDVVHAINKDPKKKTDKKADNQESESESKKERPSKK